MTAFYNGYILDGMNEFERNVKRAFDFVVALICLIVFSPLFLYCYFIIKREDGGSVIYKQERIGRFGRPFYIYKFRSMVENAEDNGPVLCESDEDDRLTKAGRFLRARARPADRIRDRVAVQDARHSGRQFRIRLPFALAERSCRHRHRRR